MNRLKAVVAAVSLAVAFGTAAPAQAAPTLDMRLHVNGCTADHKKAILEIQIAANENDWRRQAAGMPAPEFGRRFDKAVQDMLKQTWRGFIARHASGEFNAAAGNTDARHEPQIVTALKPVMKAALDRLAAQTGVQMEMSGRPRERAMLDCR